MTSADRAEEVARSFDLGREVREVTVAARGQQGRVWRIVTERGAYAVKELLVRQSEADAVADVGFQEAAMRAGTVTLPRPLLAATGRVLAEVGSLQLRAYEWVDLAPMDPAVDAAVVGATVAGVHRVQHEPARPLHPWYTDPVGEQRWRQLQRHAADARAPFAEQLAAEVPHLLALERLLEPPRTLQNCHRDLWADNVLPTPSGGMCVIDWENCGLADPSYEVPMMLVDFGLGDANRIRQLYGAYVEAGGSGRVRGRGDFSMVIAQFGHFWEAAVASYTRPDATTEARAAAVGRVEELLVSPLRPHTVEAMLDAVSGMAATGTRRAEPARPLSPRPHHGRMGR